MVNSQFFSVIIWVNLIKSVFDGVQLFVYSIKNHSRAWGAPFDGKNFHLKLWSKDERDSEPMLKNTLVNIYITFVANG